MKDPTSVSVALCTYNGEQFLQEQLNSIVAQTHLPAELVVNDDRSSDATMSILQRFARSAPFPVRYEVNPERLGSIQNFARAISRCTSKIIALCDQDDVWKAQKIAAIVACFDHDPEAIALFSDADLADENLRLLHRSLFQSLGFTPQDQQIMNSGDALSLLLRKTVVCGATLSFSAAFRNVILPVPAITRKCWDHDGWIALLAATFGGLRAIEDRLILYRQHQHQQIGAEAQTHGLAARYRRAKQFRSEGILSSIADLEKVLERLRGVEKAPPRALAILRDKLQHLRSRLQILQSSRSMRGIDAIRELCTRRYHRYSSGLSSLLGDLLL